MTDSLLRAPERPRDVWRICGQPITPGEGSGCACGPNDPSRWVARRALARLESEAVR